MKMKMRNLINLAISSKIQNLAPCLINNNLYLNLYRMKIR